jgi:hypothetical protein
MSPRCLRLAALLAAATLTSAGCSDDLTSADASELEESAGGVGPGGICHGEDGTRLPTAPRSARVDLNKPSFADPLDVTNPLFPIGQLTRVLLLGTVDGFPFRVETTLLPQTRTIDLRPRPVETLVSQYLAILGGRIHEVALDFYAQDDDGAVWYAGEDVFNYEAGVIADTDGTWLAGQDGPIAMIMPANPQVGNVWRPENICGLVFEEVTATATGVTVDGPRGAVPGALVVEELHMDATLEDKIFAPGYGEFSTGSGANLEAVALAIPIDALATPVPAELLTLSSGAEAVFEAAEAGDWIVAAAAAGTMAAAWNTFAAGTHPPMLEAQMNDALAGLAAEVTDKQTAAAREASIQVARASLDFQLRHRPVAEIDLDHLDLWARQLVVDLAAADLAGVLSDVAIMKWIRDRLAGDVTVAALGQLDARLNELRANATARDMAGTTGAAGRLRAMVAGIRIEG